MVSRKATDFMSRINAAAKGIPPEREASPDAPREAGFVGKVLADSNRSLDAKIEEATQAATDSKAEAERLRRVLNSGDVAIHVDPARVRISPYQDRHPCAFTGKEFLAFVEEIVATGGNREPGIVRPIQDDPDHDYELAAGHRRHRACLEAKLPFFCFVRGLTDEELLIAMATENKGRKDLTNFERGRHYARLLEDGKFDSERSMATALNEPRTGLRRLLAYGELPSTVVAAFPDPRAIRVTWVAPLVEAYKSDPDAIEATARTTRSNAALSPTDVFKRLTGAHNASSIVADSNRVLASVRLIHDRKAIVLYKDAPDELLDKLKRVIEEYHKDHGEPEQ